MTVTLVATPDPHDCRRVPCLVEPDPLGGHTCPHPGPCPLTELPGQADMFGGEAA